MPILLRPVPDVPDAVGVVDGAPLTYQGRTPHVGGRPVAHEEIAEDLAAAVDAAATALWGGDYVNALARTTSLNRRTVTPDRIAKNGLPAWVLRLLGSAAAAGTPRAMGYLVLAAVELVDRGPYSQGDALARTPPEDRHDLGVVSRAGMDVALSLVLGARDARERPTGKVVEDREADR